MPKVKLTVNDMSSRTFIVDTDEITDPAVHKDDPNEVFDWFNDQSKLDYDDNYDTEFEVLLEPVP